MDRVIRNADVRPEVEPTGSPCDAPQDRGLARMGREELEGYARHLERDLTDVTRLLARLIACGGLGYGFECRVFAATKEKALDWIACVRPDWTPAREFEEAFAEVQTAAGYPPPSTKGGARG